MAKKQIELLNSEGPILILIKEGSYPNGEPFFTLIFNKTKDKLSLNKIDVQHFIKGAMILEDKEGKEWDYSTFSEGMKPGKQELENFIK